MLYLASPLPFFGSFGWIENTFLSIPFSLLSIYFLIKCFQCQYSKYYLYISSLLLSCAILVHGENLFFLPAPFISILIIENHTHLNKIKLLKLLSTLLIPLITVSIGISILYLNMIVEFGNAGGGGDQSMFVPFVHPKIDHLFRFTMFSMAHFFEIANIILHSNPLIICIFFILWLELIFKLFKRSSINDTANKEEQLCAPLEILGLYSLAFFSFITLWNFDLGFPHDIDLMLSLSAPVSLFIYAYCFAKPNWLILVKPSIFLAAIYNLSWFSCLQALNPICSNFLLGFNRAAFPLQDYLS